MSIFAAIASFTKTYREKGRDIVEILNHIIMTLKGRDRIREQTDALKRRRKNDPYRDFGDSKAYPIL